MKQDLDKLLKQRIERFYRRLIKAYENRMQIANDKAYAHEQFEKWAKAGVMIKRDWDKSYNTFINLMNEAYRLGNTIESAIKTLRERSVYNVPLSIKQVDNLDTGKDKPSTAVRTFLDLPLLDKSIAKKTEAKQITENEPKEEEQTVPEWNKFSDLELTCMFADQVTKDKFLEYINSKAEKPDSNGKVTETTLDEELPSLKNKEFTTARQVVAVHFMLKYMQVKNADKTEIARFIQFLTGKNYDNIYKRVLNPFNVNDKVFREDLRFVRGYFERLGLYELVKMINNELDIDS